MSFDEERGFKASGGYRSTPINKGVVLESYKAACQFLGWARFIEEKISESSVWDGLGVS
ncbi:MAG: hypothetical protein SWK76_01190 [Actinomycetota bacterium]|nr:hypothetical protein [Actinomycetota bacterium]